MFRCPSVTLHIVNQLHFWDNFLSTAFWFYIINFGTLVLCFHGVFFSPTSIYNLARNIITRESQTFMEYLVKMWAMCQVEPMKDSQLAASNCFHRVNYKIDIVHLLCKAISKPTVLCERLFLYIKFNNLNDFIWMQRKNSFPITNSSKKYNQYVMLTEL